jgi:hypothetical protein
MLNRDIGLVQGAVPGELFAVEENGLLSPGGGALVLVEVGAGEAPVSAGRAKMSYAVMISSSANRW